MQKPKRHFQSLLLAVIFSCFMAPALASPERWQREWPQTDFSKTSVDFGEIKSGGPPKDGIPPIDHPVFKPIADVTDIEDTEPVIGLVMDGIARAYPIRILMWHEIVNDRIGEVPIAVTFCPLCNAAIVFDRRIDGMTLDFGTTGKLRNSDLVMWDRQTESWWQQFTGEAIVGTLTGKRLEVLPARLESLASFRQRTDQSAQILIPNNSRMRAYGSNPYRGYDSGYPFLYDGELPKDIDALQRVISLAGKEEAWSLALLREKGSIITSDGTVLSWQAGQNSALDHGRIAEGRDVGTVTARKDGQDVVYFVDFAFAFHAFRPDAPIHTLP
ncbi:DUF3179 domain-containing protein [Aestuariispira insulae]|uniref:Uncharacterized protein DUF3179 n=1 Tax=Aestuariispira insulae TaxID=1461337 RepID=A0A3D9HX60_9PROT|nr:DUF3179 domain-containing protein [Aestuariispira insulae]RED54005.1 uncharacterized protein DUF3179 [Aestuariispira insulae]